MATTRSHIREVRDGLNLKPEFTEVSQEEKTKTEEQASQNIPDICADFDRLDHTDVSDFSDLDIKLLKQSMSQAVTNALLQIKERICANPNLDSYNEYCELFDKVTHSKILSAHNKYPTLDKIFGKKILGSQQKLLGMIRRDAMQVLQNKLDAEGPSYSDKLEVINEAKTKPLFNMHRSNIPSFFRPEHTNAHKTLDILIIVHLLRFGH